MRRFYQKLSPTQFVVLSFALVISIGALLLTLPISNQQRIFTPLVDVIFTATSAVCVTGLVTLETGTYFSMFGQAVILVLIQIGGLGLMTFTTMMFVILGRRISLRDRLLIAEQFNQNQLSGAIKLVLSIAGLTGLIELIGAIFLSFRFIPLYGVGKGIWYSVFHSISAFCNAGFDLLGDGRFRSLIDFANDPIVSLTIASLIVFGGLGFTVLKDLNTKRSWKKLTLHSKVVLSATGILLVIGMLGFAVMEFNNPDTLGSLDWGGKILATIFQGVTPRTAGFATIDYGKVEPETALLTVILMFTGASPSSTGGGVKTTTMATVILMLWFMVRTGNEPTIFNRRISRESLDKAIMVVLIGMIIVMVSTTLVLMSEPFGFQQVAFEVVSAFGTVGLSTGITSSLTSFSKIVLIFTMFIGRVGGLSLALSLWRKYDAHNVQWPEEHVLIG